MNYTKLIIPIIVLALIVGAYLFGLNTAPQKLSPFERKEWKYKRTIDSFRVEYAKLKSLDSMHLQSIQRLREREELLKKKTVKANQDYESIHYRSISTDSLYWEFARLYPSFKSLLTDSARTR